MKLRAFPYTYVLLMVVALVPSGLHADSFCMTDPAPYQYQFCGVWAFPETFTVNASGVSNGVYAAFEGFHANFASSVYANLYRNGVVIATSAESLTNQQLTTNQMMPFFSGVQVQSGDEIDLVLHDQTDPNGQQFFSSKNYLNNVDKQNHTWAQLIAANQCGPVQTDNCVFVGFEDLPQGEQESDPTEPDYNDFKMWLYGVGVSPAVAPVPEPSSLLLLTGVPLAFAVSKLRKLL
jgi:hypothetical protein